MKCPNCDKEISPEFNVCPWCGYKPKKCNKPEHQDIWLPVEARFCPRCGEPLPDEKAGGAEAGVNKSYPKKNQEFVVEGVRFNMVYVEGGSFMMGATAEQDSDYNSEKPIHRVELSDYYIGETVVTQALWRAVMNDNPSVFKGDNLPVETVSWDDCEKFLKQLNKKTGKTFRLPTEAEWEYAARGGCKSRGFKFAGSNDIDEVAWYWYNSGNRIHPVKQKVPNELGIYDMSGNVWEWCQDWYGDYSSSSCTNPIGHLSGDFRVFRGGSWRGEGYAWDARVAWRNCQKPNYRFHHLGFRLVLP